MRRGGGAPDDPGGARARPWMWRSRSTGIRSGSSCPARRRVLGAQARRGRAAPAGGGRPGVSRGLGAPRGEAYRSGAESFIAGTASTRIELADVDALYVQLAAAEVLTRLAYVGLATRTSRRASPPRSTATGTHLVLPLGRRRPCAAYAGADLPIMGGRRIRIAQRAERPGDVPTSMVSSPGNSPLHPLDGGYIARSMRARLFAATVAALLLPRPGSARAIRSCRCGRSSSGMQCTGYSVVQGTDDQLVRRRDPRRHRRRRQRQGPRMLLRCPGRRSTATGVGPGFSGSPIYCPDEPGAAQRRRDLGVDQRVRRRRRARDADRGDPRRRRSTRRQPRRRPRRGRASAGAIARAARKPLATPLTVSGVDAALGRALERAGATAGRPVLAAPAGPARLVPAADAAPRRGGRRRVLERRHPDRRDRHRRLRRRRPGVGVRPPARGRRRARALLLQDAYVFRIDQQPDPARRRALDVQARRRRPRPRDDHQRRLDAVAGPHRRAAAHRAGPGVRPRPDTGRGGDRHPRRRRGPVDLPERRLVDSFVGAARGRAGRRRGCSAARPRG